MKSAASEFEREGLLEGLASQQEREARIALLQELLEAGVSMDELRRAVGEDRLALLPVELVFARDTRYTVKEAAKRSGFDEEFVLKDRLALGLPRPGPNDRVFSDADIEGLRALRQVRDIGVPEEDILLLTRVVGQGSARTAEAAMQLMGSVFMRAGDTERDLGLRYADVAMKTAPLLGTLLESPLRLHMREVIRREVVGRAERAAGRLPGARDVAVCFADLVGFTSLGESLPATEVGNVAERLEEMALELTTPPARVVKMIGDAAMLVSPDAGPLVGSALDLVTAAEAKRDGFPRLRAGIAYGAALPRLGDWYGRPVNLASRITSVALPGSVLATREVRTAAGDGYRWSRAPSRRLKGVEGAVALFRARHSPTET